VTEVITLSKLVNPTDRQREFLEAVKTYKYILYGGAAGGGKSYILRWCALIIALKAFLVHGIRNVKVGLFCEDYPSLTDRQISKMAAEFPEKLGTLTKSQTDGLVFKLRPEFGGGMVLPRNLDEPSKYNSTEFVAILVDELTRNKPEVFDELRKRLRWPGFPEGYNFPFIGGTNPGGIGHAWVKRLWIDEDFPPELESVKHTFKLIKARAQDNPHNPSSYYSDLLTLPEHLRRAYAEGDWDLFAGQFFAEWRKELHVIRDFPVAPYWYKWRACDWGYDAYTSIGWYCKSPENKIFKYRERYVRQKTVPELATVIKEAEAGESIAYGVLDPSCWDSSRGVSIAEQFSQQGISWTKADNDRISGWQRVREFIAWQRNKDGLLTQHPAFQVFESCTNTIRTIPALVFDEHKKDDVDTDGEDHAADETRYALMSRPGLTIVPREHLAPDDREAWDRALHEEKNHTYEVTQ
jgi:phage terminase large subunit